MLRNIWSVFKNYFIHSLMSFSDMLVLEVCIQDNAQLHVTH